MRIPPSRAFAAAMLLAAGLACSSAVERTSLAGTTRAYRCEDGYRFVARFEPERVWLFLGDRTLSLPQVPSSSGIHYTDGRFTFRASGPEGPLAPPGNEASTETAGASHAKCLNQPTAVPWEEARLNGVDFRAVGQASGWILEIDDGSGIVFVTDDGKARYTFPAGSSETRDASTVHASSAGGRSIRIEREARDCIHSATGERFDVTVRVTLDGRDYQGCGRVLR